MIDREWKAGDKIDLVLPMKPQRVKCIDEVEANRGRVALRYGPLVYNIEASTATTWTACSIAMPS